MDDGVFVNVFQHSTEAVWSGKKATLFVQVDCTSNQKTIFLTHPWLVDSGAEIRFDKEEATTLEADQAHQSQDMKKLVFKASDLSGMPDLEKKLISHKLVTIRYQDIGKATITASFLLGGLGKKIMAACMTPKKPKKTSKGVH